jgi:hypothetical protein
MKITVDKISQSPCTPPTDVTYSVKIEDLENIESSEPFVDWCLLKELENRSVEHLRSQVLYIMNKVDKSQNNNT